MVGIAIKLEGPSPAFWQGQLDAPDPAKSGCGGILQGDLRN